MIKGNLIIGKNQSVVMHAESLHDLIKLAESKSHECGCEGLRASGAAIADSRGVGEHAARYHTSNQKLTGTMSLRVDLTHCDLPVEDLFGSKEAR